MCPSHLLGYSPVLSSVYSLLSCVSDWRIMVSMVIWCYLLLRRTIWALIHLGPLFWHMYFQVVSLCYYYCASTKSILRAFIFPIFIGVCFTMPIVGGWLADSKFGKFSVILFSAIIYLIGTVLLPLASITKDKSEHSTWAARGILVESVFKKVVYITGLFLVAFGTGGIKANVSPFGAEQVSNRRPAAIQGTVLNIFVMKFQQV